IGSARPSGLIHNGTVDIQEFTPAVPWVFRSERFEKRQDPAIPHSPLLGSCYDPRSVTEPFMARYTFPQSLTAEVTENGLLALSAPRPRLIPLIANAPGAPRFNFSFLLAGPSGGKIPASLGNLVNRRKLLDRT